MAKTKAKRAISKAELVEHLMEDMEEAGVETSKKQVKTLLDILPAVAAVQVKKHGVFVLPGLARFNKRHRPAVKAKTKKVRNPATGEMVWQKPRPASIVVKVRPASQLKQAVNN